jgi:hypothetical protein
MGRLRDTYLQTWEAYAPLPELRAAFALWSRLRPPFSAAHEDHVVSAYQQMLPGREVVEETATGNALQHMQWWPAAHWRDLLQSFVAA